MLVTDPAHRATLAEVIASPWLNKGFEAPTDSYLVPREPLRPEELDGEVLRGMAGFEFGTEENIRQRMSDLLMSETYRKVNSDWETRRTNQRKGREWESEGKNGEDETSASSRSASVVSPSRGKPSRRFSGFDFYKGKLFKANATTPNAKDEGRPDRSTASGRSFGEELEPLDPTRGFHPLISIYYLVREKMERERVYGPGLFASSELSLAQSNNTQANGMPGAPSGRAPAYGMALPRLSIPETSHMPPRGSEAVRGSASGSLPFEPSALPRNRGESLNQRADRVNDLRAAGVMQHPEEDFDRSRLDEIGKVTSGNGGSGHRRSWSMSGGMGSPTDAQIPRMVSSASQNVMADRDRQLDEDLVRDTQGMSLRQNFVPEPEPLNSDSFETAPSATPLRSESRAQTVPTPPHLDSSTEMIAAGGPAASRDRHSQSAQSGSSEPSAKIDAKPVYLKGLFR